MIISIYSAFSQCNARIVLACSFAARLVLVGFLLYRARQVERREIASRANQLGYRDVALDPLFLIRPTASSSFHRPY